MDLDKELLEIAPCPWCKVTPKFKMYLNDLTWRPHLKCEYAYCPVNPVSKCVNIRKTQKYSALAIRDKIHIMVSQWNIHNPCKAYEGMVFEYEKIAREERERDGFR